MRKLLQILVSGVAVIIPTLTAHAIEDYKGQFTTQALFTMCSSNSPVLREKCNIYLQGLMYGLRIQASMRSDNAERADMTVCLPETMTAEAARMNMLSFIYTVTDGNPSSNRDDGNWVAYMSLEAGHLCGIVSK